jgi:hypothetical protein
MPRGAHLGARGVWQCRAGRRNHPRRQELRERPPRTSPPEPPPRRRRSASTATAPGRRSRLCSRGRVAVCGPPSSRRRSAGASPSANGGADVALDARCAAVGATGRVDPDPRVHLPLAGDGLPAYRLRATGPVVDGRLHASPQARTQRSCSRDVHSFRKDACATPRTPISARSAQLDRLVTQGGRWRPRLGRHRPRPGHESSRIESPPQRHRGPCPPVSSQSSARALRRPPLPVLNKLADGPERRHSAQVAARFCRWKSVRDGVGVRRQL